MLWAGAIALRAGLDPALRFRVLPTEHFVIHFHQGEERLAQRLAVIAEETWRALAQPLGVTPPARTRVVLADQTELFNGYATPVPYNTVVLYAVTPSGAGSDFKAAVVATFAMGTAVGDFAATTMRLGYLASAVVFAALITVPALGYRFGHWNAIGCFWTAYVLTRPLGASVADWLGKPHSASGLGLGSGQVALVCGILITVLVAWLTVTRRDVQVDPGAAASAAA